MKRTSVIIYVLAVVVAAFAFQGCGTSIGENISLTKTKLETSLANKTELVVDNMIEVYSNWDDLSFQNEFDDAMMGALSNNNISLSSDLNGVDVRKKIALLNLYKQAVQEYASLADEGLTGKQASFSKCCSAIQKEYENLGDSAALAYAKRINSYLKSTRYDQNEVIRILLVDLEMIWKGDAESLNEKLSDSFQKFQTSLANIPDDSFSAEKLSKYVYQPYEGKRNLVQAYKLNLIKARRQELKKVVQKQDNISSAIYCVNCALTEFLKRDTDKTAIVNYLSRVDILLGDNVKTESED